MKQKKKKKTFTQNKVLTWFDTSKFLAQNFNIYKKTKNFGQRRFKNYKVTINIYSCQSYSHNLYITL